jgi:cell division protein FtsB
VRTITLATVLVLGIFTLAPQAQVLIEQQQQLADIRAQVAQSEADVEAMKAERTRWEDPVYIRAQARNRLYYVMPGEVSYLVMDASGIDESDVSGTVGAMIAARTNNGEITTSVREAKSNWVDALVETVVRSGIEQPEAEAKK